MGSNPMKSPIRRIPTERRPTSPTWLSLCVVGVLLSLLLTVDVRAQGDCAALRGDEDILPGQWLDDGAQAWRHRQLPSKGDVDRALSDLDYGDELPLVYAIDLNGDGRPELLLASPGARLCGNAGCPYVLLAAGTFRKIGEFFGQLAVLDERINGHRVIQTFSRVIADTTNLDTYVFDGRAYRLVSHVIVEQCGLEQWGRRMRKSR